MKPLGCSLTLFLSLIASIAFADGSSELVAALQKLQSADVTFEALGRAYKMRTNAPNAEVVADVVRACAAGLLYANRQDFYTAQIRPRIPDVDNFERSLRVPCAKCNGQGKFSQPCSQCGGSGKCKSFNCHDGQAEFKGLNGRVDYRPCPACKGTGNCPKCNGSGTVMSACPACMGRGGSFSSTQALALCREYTQRALTGMGASAGIASPGSAGTVAPPNTGSQAIDSRTLPGMPQVPIVRPPPDVQVNPEVKAVFDQLVTEYFAKRMKEFRENEKNGWVTVNGTRVPGDESNRRKIRAEWFDVPSDLPSGYWGEAERIAEERKQGQEAVQYDKRIAAQRLAEAKTKQDNQQFIEQFVSAAILRAESQISSSSLLLDYALSSDEAARVESKEFTTVQRVRALQELWDRAMEHPRMDGIRLLFVPFPSGLKYTVADVRPHSGTGNYILKLNAVEARPGKETAGAMPARGTYREIGQLLRKSISLNIASPTILIPADDPDVVAITKDQAVISGEWIIPVLVVENSGLKPYNFFFRSDDEYLALTDSDEDAGPPATFFAPSTPQPP